MEKHSPYHPDIESLTTEVTLDICSREPEKTKLTMLSRMDGQPILSPLSNTKDSIQSMGVCELMHIFSYKNDTLPEQQFKKMSLAGFVWLGRSMW